MNERQVGVVILAVGLLVGWAITHAGGNELRSSEQQLESKASRKTAYLHAKVPAGAFAWVTNPRADQGRVFYITDIACEAALAIRLPPEIDPDTDQTVLACDSVPSSYSTRKEPITFNTPFPFETRLLVRNLGVVDRDFVFSGYYSSAHPVIEEMEVEVE